jgi:tetratricopeptide (TPR) repeat protein
MNVNPKQFRVGRGIERPTWLPEPRPSHLVLDEVGGAAGYVLWLLLNDCGLWTAAGPRAELFAPGGREWAEDAWPPELVDALSVLRAASAAPELARAPDLAAAAASVWEWAERQGFNETPLQFAELGARLEPESSARAATAARFCRRHGGLHARAAQWYARAVRLARLQDDEIAFVTARLGWGILEFNQGRYLHAESHFNAAFRRAMRVGRRSTAGLARHCLLGVAVASGRYEIAMQQAFEAVRLYAAHHPRFPVLAHDVAFAIAAQGYYSSAIPVLLKTLPLLGEDRERILVLATLARAAGAARDRVRFERAAAEVLRMAESGPEMSESSIFQVAEGARSFEQWERAESLARRALGLAAQTGNGYIVSAARGLIESITRRAAGDVDLIPEEGSEIDQLVTLVTARLAKHTAPPDGRAVPVEKFPVY